MIPKEYIISFVSFDEQYNIQHNAPEIPHIVALYKKNFRCFECNKLSNCFDCGCPCSPDLQVKKLNEYILPLVDTLEKVDDPLARERLKELKEKPYVLGFMIWGSRATRFGQKDTDWDILIYVTEDFYQTLSLDDMAIFEFDESVNPKRLVIDYTYFADSIFKDQLNSPLDIDHAAYEEAVVIYDRSGKLEEWRKKLARYPEEEHIDRLKIKYMQVHFSFGNARLDDERGLHLDRQLNLYRTIVSAANLWFSIKKVWCPPIKWWSKHAKRFGMDSDIFQLFSDAIEKPDMENVGELVKKLREMTEVEGVDLKTFARDFFETITPVGRPKLVRHSYI